MVPTALVTRDRLPLHLGPMKRYVFTLSLAAATAFACVNLSDSGGQFFFVVAPVLDSVFVGDTLPARNPYLDDGAGHHSDPGPIIWSITPTSVATIDASGRIAGVSKGAAVVVATRTDSIKSGAVVIVSRRLELTTLMDTIYVMPGDTITVPLAIVQKNPLVTTLRFDTSATPSVYTIDTVSGLVTAHGDGVVRYVARLTDGTNSVADTGAVVVMSLTDTTGNGRYFMTASGTAIRHQSGGALALNYTRLNNKLAFRLVDSLTTTALDERVLITLPDSVLAVGTFEIVYISLQEATTRAGSVDPFCNPKRPWARWSSIPSDPNLPVIVAYSHGRTPTDSVAGSLSITRYAPAVGGGAIVSGRYLFTAQRRDLYGDPLGSETIRGTFVAPLRERHITCQA
jgi:hypothetical protein